MTNCLGTVEFWTTVVISVCAGGLIGVFAMALINLASTRPRSD